MDGGMETTGDLYQDKQTITRSFGFIDWVDNVTCPTQSIKPNDLVILPTDASAQFLQKITTSTISPKGGGGGGGGLPYKKDGGCSSYFLGVKPRPRYLLLFILNRSTATTVDRRPVSSVGLPDYRAGGRGFEPQTGPTLRVLK